NTRAIYMRRTEDEKQEAKFLLREGIFLLLDLLVFRGGGFDQQKTQMIFDPGTSERRLKNRGLKRMEAGEKVASIDIVLKLLHGLNFSRAEETSIQKRKDCQQDTGRTH